MPVPRRRGTPSRWICSVIIALTSTPRNQISRLLFIKRQDPASFEVGSLEAPSGFEPENRGFAVPCLTTWLWRHDIHYRFRRNHYSLAGTGAGNEARTRYLHLGKVALYRMSYARKWCLRPESNWRHTDFQSVALPTELPRHILFPPPKENSGGNNWTRTSDPLLVRQVL